MSNVAYIRKISSLLGCLSRPPTKGITAILAYHGVSDKESRNCVTVQRFISHLEFINQLFHIIKLSELCKIIQREHDDQKNYVAITFDDAYQNFYQYSYPELRKRNIPAAVFVPAGLVGRYNCWDYDHNHDYPYLRIMNWKELRELDFGLIEIGSHGYNHKRMAPLRDDQLRIEILKSKEILESELNYRIDMFAYPYGELFNFDNRAIKILKESGYRYALTTHFGRKNTSIDLYRLNRINIWDDDEVEDVRDKLFGYYDWLELKEKMAYYLRNILMLK